ncbi:MAG: hypothetical protein HY226_06065 [Candidatus Vogelbacteria bacterium]|nr:hypothetical protein [Candidatus Vogelbacteria bacterium]
MSKGRDCEELSPKSREIFEKIKKFFSPDPWKNPRWTEDGRICDSTTFYDLRKSDDRKSRIEWQQHMIGYVIGLNAKRYLRAHPSLEGLGISPVAANFIELLHLYEELDYQIETGDFVG